MWLAGAVGVATALGYYIVAFGVALFAVIVLAALKYIAHRMIGDDDDTAPADGARNQPGR
jgi:putative Mg2+ transporter-C (MgtC) family protein